MGIGFRYVYSPERVRAASEAVLSSKANQDRFDALARAAAAALDTPVALVTVVEDARQCFVGQYGLSLPWNQTRETPLTHSFCQYVVADDSPLIIADARLDARVCTNQAVAELGVIAYAGYPLRLDSGIILGSLCAIATRPRDWSERDQKILELLAGVASHLLDCEIKLRLGPAGLQIEPYSSGPEA